MTGEKKKKLLKYKNCVELELLNDDLDLQVPTLRKTWEFIFLEKQLCDVTERRYIRLTEATPEGTR